MLEIRNWTIKNLLMHVEFVSNYLASKLDIEIIAIHWVTKNEQWSKLEENSWLTTKYLFHIAYIKMVEYLTWSNYFFSFHKDQGRIREGGFWGLGPPGYYRGAKNKKKKRKGQKKRGKKGGKKGKQKEKDKSTWRIGLHSSTRGAPRGAPGKKTSGAPNWRRWSEGAILQLRCRCTK